MAHRDLYRKAVQILEQNSTFNSHSQDERERFLRYLDKTQGTDRELNVSGGQNRKLYRAAVTACEAARSVFDATNIEFEHFMAYIEHY